MPRQLIVTADDFGLNVHVNTAVDEAHRGGILTSASLMVGGTAAGDAVERARRLPSLAVGLHLALVDATPLSPPESIPDLVGLDGRLRSGLVGAGLAWFLRPSARRQLRLEIEAQFRAFAATGLSLDHVNGHHHMHVHPTVSRLVVDVGREYGLRAVRLPVENTAVLRRADPEGARAGAATQVMRPWAMKLRHRLRRAGLVTSDHLFGLAWSGRMSERRWLDLLAHLPEGVSEIYCHPSTAIGVNPSDEDAAPRPQTSSLSSDRSHPGAAELQALTSNAVRQCIESAGIRLTSFSELAARFPG